MSQKTASKDPSRAREPRKAPHLKPEFNVTDYNFFAKEMVPIYTIKKFVFQKMLEKFQLQYV